MLLFEKQEYLSTFTTCRVKGTVETTRNIHPRVQPVKGSGRLPGSADHLEPIPDVKFYGYLELPVDQLTISEQRPEDGLISLMVFWTRLESGLPFEQWIGGIPHLCKKGNSWHTGPQSPALLYDGGGRWWYCSLEKGRLSRTELVETCIIHNGNIMGLEALMAIELERLDAKRVDLLRRHALIRDNPVADIAQFEYTDLLSIATYLK